MPYEKTSDGKNISYTITGKLKIWIEKLQKILDMDESDDQANYYFCIAALSMGEQARIKWTKRRFFRNKVTQIESLLMHLRENQIFFLDVVDYLANNMSLAEIEEMRERIISDVTEYFPAKQEEHASVQEEHEPAVLPQSSDSSDSSDLWSRLSTHVVSRYTYPYKRFPTMSYLEYHNSVFLHIESSSDGSVTLQMLPGRLATTKSTQLYSSVFLSHSHYDKDFARKLARDLQIAKIKVWIDEAEIKIGESLIAKMESGIQDMEYLGVIISPNSVTSPWVAEELRAAMHLGINKRKVKVLPILYKPCELPTFLLDKKYIDFSNPAKYKISLDSLVNTLLDLPPCVLLTAKEAAKLIKTTYNPLGSLCGISQQGICQQYIPNQIQIRGDWYYADAKTGRSTVWIFEYYDKSNRGYSSYGVTDGITGELLTGGVLANGVKPLNFNFIDSDMAISAAIERAKYLRAIPTNETAYFINSMLKFCLLLGDYLWFIIVFDITLSEVTFIVEVNAHTGEIARSYTP